MLTGDLRYECVTSGFVIDESRIKEFFSGYPIKLVKQAPFFLPDHDYLFIGISEESCCSHIRNFCKSA